MTIEKYGLRQKSSGKIVGFSTNSNEGADCCVSTAYQLDVYTPTMWLVDDAVDAEYVRLNSTVWYNADYDTPENPYNPDDLEVVKITISVEMEVVKIPTFEEYMQERYNTPGSRHYDPGHYKMVMDKHTECAKRGKGMSYSVYDLHVLLREKVTK
jgi:hypothetical protein